MRSALKLTQDLVQQRVSVFPANLPFLVLENCFSLVTRTKHLPQLDQNGMLALPKTVVSESV